MTVTIDNDKLTFEDMAFLKIITDENGDPVTFPIPVGTDPIVIKPSFEPLDFAAKFVFAYEGNEVQYASKDVAYDSPIEAPTAPAADQVPAGYTFVGWNTDPNATKTGGKRVYGIHVNVTDSDLEGAILHEDPDREMSRLHSVYAWGVVGVVFITTLWLLAFGHQSWQYLAFFFMMIPLLSAILFSVLSTILLILAHTISDK